ncbi:MAG: hypothetical protein EA403_02635 [Spirochaetaceae bacterium]|nr:MAG: hypothetical protein EA403_02635 [Spirochaetaceae bacterium]
MHKGSLPLIVVAVIVVLAGCSNPTGSGLGRTPSSTVPMVLVPAGSFQRDGESANTSVVTQPFWIGRYEVTRAQFLAVMGADPSFQSDSTGLADPVQFVHWYHAIAFCNKLSLAEGRTPVYSIPGIDFDVLEFDDIPVPTPEPPDSLLLNNSLWDSVTVDWNADGYRLPTATEWMWAAMGADTANKGAVNTSGYQKDFPGDDGTNDIDDFAWYWHNADPLRNGSGSTRPAGTRLPNELGIYDMGGNVIEWCWDWYSDSLPPGELSDYRGPATGVDRVSRGGSWGDWHDRLRITHRDDRSPGGRNGYVGFRVVRR